MLSGMNQGPTWLYLHGFASSPASNKARAFVKWGEEHGLAVRALDLRVPSLEHLRFSSILLRVRAEIGAEDRVVLIGSSLGGLTACRVAEVEPRVCALFLMAPAFRLAERWRARLGEDAWRRWKEQDALEVPDHATGKTTFVDHGFVAELEALDVGFPDVRVPTCIVHGTKDDVVDVELSRAWARDRRHVRLVEVDDGHELARSVPRILAEATAFFAPFGVQAASENRSITR
ncbi:MAG: alpha/beta fold hydrolase [Labilithrix sp.]|nr:alpha/beta fold hydrolase [Labilithrix sp.]MCW5813177.1 alpha/beta fold hydrolase [Labilithrix sp.]